MNVQQLLDLMGCVVSFDYKPLKDGQGEITHIKGLVTGVSIELSNDHAISVLDYHDSDDFYHLDRIENFKAVQLDPYAFFENIKNGTITVDI